VLNNLYKQTQLQDTFGMNMVALGRRPAEALDLKAMIEAFISHRREVVTRRTVFDLRKARERGHILEGLAVALSNVDEVIELIKRAPGPAEAKRELMAKAWRSELVTQMLERVGRGNRAARSGPTGFRRLRADRRRLPPDRCAGAGDHRPAAAPADRPRAGPDPRRVPRSNGRNRGSPRHSRQARAITAIIVEELTSIREEFGDKRRSEIVFVAEDISLEDLIAPQDMVVTFSHGGYVKSQPLADYRAQRRGGRGKMAAATKEDDFIERLFHRALA
jgi:DNA gyrase subunit A